MKYLIAGLGNIGTEYKDTRHNIGFIALDALAKASNVVFTDKRLAFHCELKFKGRTFVLIKPTTFMNRSGRAINYWLQKEKIPVENLLVIADDLALPFGTIRIRAKGGSAGHNGLGDIEEILGHQNYARLRFGIGAEFNKGQQVDYVLGNWSDEELKAIPERLEKIASAVKSFGTIGIATTMNSFNNK